MDKVDGPRRKRRQSSVAPGSEPSAKAKPINPSPQGRSGKTGEASGFERYIPKNEDSATDHVYAPAVPRFYTSIKNRTWTRKGIILSLVAKVVYFGVMIFFCTQGNAYWVTLQLGSLYSVTDNEILVKNATTTPLLVPGLFFGYIFSALIVSFINLMIWRNKIDEFMVKTPWAETSHSLIPSFSEIAKERKLCFSINYFTVYEKTNILIYLLVNFFYMLIQMFIVFILCVVSGVRDLSTIFGITGLLTVIFVLNKAVPPGRLTFVVLRNLVSAAALGISFYVLYFQSTNAPQSTLKTQMLTWVVIVYSLEIFITPWLRWERVRRVRQYQQFMEHRMFAITKLSSLMDKNNDPSLTDAARKYKREKTSFLPVGDDWKIQSPDEIEEDLEDEYFYRCTEGSSKRFNACKCDVLFNLLCVCDKYKFTSEPQIIIYRQKILDVIMAANNNVEDVLEMGNVTEEDFNNQVNYVLGTTNVAIYQDVHKLNNMPEFYKDIFVYRIMEVRSLIDNYLLDVWLEVYNCLFVIIPLIISLSSLPNESAT
jgi:hypothetical protein